MNLYDLLDVEPDASTDEIRVAWKTSVDDLDPGDRRFRAFSDAAAVLLDPVRRAEYDASLAEAAEAEAEPEPDPVAVPSAAPVVLSKSSGSDAPLSPAGDDPVASSDRAGVPLAVVIVAVVATILMAAVTTVAWLGSDSAPDSLSRSSIVDESEIPSAQAAAETAIVPVLSFDYRTLEADAAAARSYMTDDYREKYDQTFAVVSDNAPSTKTVVSVEVVASGIVRTGEDLVDVLLFVNRPTTNKQNTEPVIYRDQVTLEMRLVDGEWLVDDLQTTPAAP